MAILKSAQLLAAIKSAVPDLAQALHKGYQDQIPVESGKLRDSQVTSIADTTVTTEWGVDYAVYVHEGYSRKDGSIVDGQPWTKPVLDEIEANPAIEEIRRKIQNL